MSYKYILFDHDGVLVDTEYWYYEATRRALAEVGIVLERASYQQIMVRGATSWELAQRKGIAANDIRAQQEQRNRWYQEYLLSEDIEIPGVVETLRRLSVSHRMAIVTTSRSSDFELIHRQREIVPLMDFVLTREDYVNSKPDPEPYLLALQRFDARREEALVIEDSARGLQAAMAAGIDCAIVHNRFTATHDFSGATCLLQTIAALPDIL